MNLPSFIKNNLLLKVTSANTIVVFIRMVFSVITQKALAILIGAEGIALVGNLKNVISFLEQFSILGTSNGIIKYIAEFKEDKTQLNNLFSTTFVFATLASIVSFLILFFASETLNELIFGLNNDYVFIFKVLAFIMPFMALNAILYALLNGLSAYKLYTKLTLLTIIISTVLIVYFTLKFNVKGSLLAISLIPIIQFLTYIILFRNSYRPYINLKSISFNLSFKSKLLSYSFMMIVVIFFINVTDVAIRNLIEKEVGIADAGYWTAMTSISKTYMQFSAAVFPLYILPRYSKITNTIDFRNEVLKIYKMLLPFIVVGMLLVFFLRDLIIQLLYTDEFLSIGSFFKWQLLGDLVKFIAIVISYQFLAKKQIGYFIFTELLSVLLFYAFSEYFIGLYGTEGIVIAHLVRYIIYFIVVLYILRNNFFGMIKVL
ncbi:O-antigen translocase [Sabulilitoribacter multivorans]|uniref:O-antigen translocase n=1 Tax=Flaviramulus multivorans TaxID=1304750 RepID=A0ABS9II34_9FLAO|nr:O-antigen translocase [Flaviramulus multivorans]MCF7560426.1 O-antigen translocase [Flaviramulus multivorans]